MRYPIILASGAGLPITADLDQTQALEAPFIVLFHQAGCWKSIYEAIPNSDKASFLPTTAGNHGSRALWTKHNDAGSYWKAVRSFLSSLK